MKKQYWQLDSNGDLSVTCETPEEATELMMTDFESLDSTGQANTQYTITPVWYTDAEYANLEEA